MSYPRGYIYLLMVFFVLYFCYKDTTFANIEINTSLNILQPMYHIEYTPPHISGQYISGYQFVRIVGTGIKDNFTGIWNNGTYTLSFYRGTGSFTTGVGYGTGNLRNLLTTTITIDRIDNTPPTFAGVIEGTTYTSPVTITFSDNLPGVTATLNGSPIINGTVISNNGTYQLAVTDIAGNTTGATFIIYLPTTPPPSGGGGASLGVRMLTYPFCSKRTCFSVYYHSICGPCTPPSGQLALPSLWPAYHYASPTLPNIHNTSYPLERIAVYQRAYRLGLISARTIQEANLEGVLYRKIAAKIVSEFAIKVLHLSPDETKICEFKDISKEPEELQYYMKLACQLGIMGLDYYGNPDTIFNPNHFVTRDQFVTMLSRMLFRNKYNLKPEEYAFFDRVRNFAVHTIRNIAHALKLNIDLYTPINWYSKHLEAIKKLGLMTNYTLTLKEFRIYVLLILYRLDTLGYEEVQKLMKQ